MSRAVADRPARTRAAPVRPWADLAWLAVPLAAAATLALASDGFFQSDDITHMLMARQAWHDWHFAIDGWGRPGFTIPYAAVAWMGSPGDALLAGRLLSVALAGVAAWCAIRIARRLDIRPAGLAGLVLLAMPSYLALSYATLTEIIASTYLAGATLLWLGRRYRWAAVLVGVLAMTRLEAVVITAAFTGLLLWRRQWLAAAIPWALLATWNLLTWSQHMGWAWALYTNRPGAGAVYGHGSLSYYLSMWGLAAGPVLMGLSLAGVVRLMRSAWTPPAVDSSWREEARLARVLIPLGVVGYVLLQTLLYWRNTHASGGYPRFLLPAAPWMAVCAAAAIQPLWLGLGLGRGRAISDGRSALRRGPSLGPDNAGAPPRSASNTEPRAEGSTYDALRAATPSPESEPLANRPPSRRAVRIVAGWVVLTAGVLAVTWLYDWRINPPHDHLYQLERRWEPIALGLGLIAIAWLGVVVRPGRSTLAIAAAVSFVSLAAHWTIRAQPYHLLPRHVAIIDVTGELAADFGHDVPITGTSPLVGWTLDRPISHSRSHPAVQWQRDAGPLLLVWDIDHGPQQFTAELLAGEPHDRLERYRRTNEQGLVLVRVFRKLDER